MSVVSLIAKRGGGGQEERRQDHERYEGEAEVEERIGGDSGPVEDADSFAERERAGGPRGTEWFGLEDGHGRGRALGVRDVAVLTRWDQ